MELNEALEVVQQVKNRYKAFDKLDELLSFFMSEYQKLPGLKDQVEGLQKEVKELSEKKDAMLLEQGQMRKSIAEDVAKHRGQANTEISGYRKKVQDETTNFQHKFEQVRDALKKLEAEHQGKLDAMQSEELALQVSLEKLRTQVQNLKKVAEEVSA